MFYYYCSKKEINYKLRSKLPEQFHKAMNFNDEIFVYLGSFKDPIATDFLHHTALLAFNNKNECISAISFGTENYKKINQTIRNICKAKTFEELDHYKEDFVEELDMLSIEKI